ncbi:AAA family ATPase, partial [Clostridium perfringens]|nr:AAA family ATPase [Clostridium perfringens]
RVKINTQLGVPAVKEMVQHIKPAATWEQLAWPRHTVAELRTISSDYSAGNGVICLFAGAGGTGKTLAAEVIASDLGKDLLRIDLSAVVSKYIGE